MADKESADPREGRDRDQGDAAEPHEEERQAEFRMELVDSLPGGRAVVGVEQEGEFVWLASKQHVSERARDEFVDQLSRIVREGWWVQNWPGN
ncbi:hypothetical protein [Streptomyces sp. NPDC008240]|uniref:hypothetical protein n=1 Tax=Streptomyces sp. NPDC008240 TaxID=3364822 RepID=UPI0036EBAC49